MRKNKVRLLFAVLAAVIIAVVTITRLKQNKTSDEIVKEINPTIGTIQATISTTGTVLPKNRLGIKPPVNGRIESIMVKEGEDIKTGQVLAWMSSTERAALMDAARGQSEKELKYWQEVYKPIPLLAPIDGEVIVATTQPGQTVTTADAVVVLSDHLIVRAQVDETDIGKVKLGQKATITLDAYPDVKIKAKVEHVYYESETVNNVTVYKADLIPEEVPSFFRSGMNATIDFIVNSKEDTLLVPLEAVHNERDERYVLLKNNGEKEPIKRIIKLGISDDKNAEVSSGLDVKDTIILKTKKYTLPTSNTGSNPFMPFRQRNRR